MPSSQPIYEEFSMPAAAVGFCPNCHTLCKNHGDEDFPDWRYPNETRAPEAGLGPDGIWYCSDSCRNQVMFETCTLAQQKALRDLVLTLASLQTVAKQLGLIYDRDLRQWYVPAKHAFDKWGLDEFKFYDFLNAGHELYRTLCGSADNEQPAFLYAAENGGMR